MQQNNVMPLHERNSLGSTWKKATSKRTATASNGFEGIKKPACSAPPNLSLSEPTKSQGGCKHLSRHAVERGRRSKWLTIVKKEEVIVQVAI